jgi:DNA-binding NtrC family response regulator
MPERFLALFVHDRPQPFEALKQTLGNVDVETCSVNTCKEAANLFAQIEPHVVFTDRILPDGSWVDIVICAEHATAPCNVIVVDAIEDTKLYLSVMEQGAYDFVVPPFEPRMTTQMVRSAFLNARNRRQAQARAAVA